MGLKMASRIVLRPPGAADARAFVEAALSSRSLHRPWVGTPSTPEQFRSWRRRMSLPSNCALLVCRRNGGEIAGVFNVTNIVMGPFRSAYLGYYAFAGHECQGLMAEGLQAVLRYAFGTLKLHRLEANIQPGNTRSIALAKACGFSLEGYSPRYLKIGGRWRDHERWAIVAR
jgi:ribosomal-protein-alanine N-acetyltransferase